MVGAGRHNPLGVGGQLPIHPRVAPPTAQPSANGRGPFGARNPGGMTASQRSVDLPARGLQSQRDCATKPKVATRSLPWVRWHDFATLKGLCRPAIGAELNSLSQLLTGGAIDLATTPDRQPGTI